MTESLETDIDPNGPGAAAARGDWETAAALWSAELAGFGTKAMPVLRYQLGDALLKLERWAEAEKVIAGGLARKPDHLRLLRLGGKSAAQLGWWPLAAERWIQVMKDEAKLPTKTMVRDAVKACCMAGLLDQAEALLTRPVSSSRSEAETRNLGSLVGFYRLRAEYEQVQGRASDDDAGFKPRSVKDVCEAFWEIEAEHDLLSWRIHDIPIWPLLRMNAFYAITQKAGLYDAPHPGLGEARDAVADEGLDAEAAAPGRSSVLLMATKKINGSEPYSDAVRLALEDKALLIDRPVDGQVLPGAVNFDRLVASFREQFDEGMVRFLTAENRFRLFLIEQAFKRRLGITPNDLAQAIQVNMAVYVGVRRGFENFFARHPVRRLILSNAYGVTTRAVVAAARAQGIRTIELQHGFMSRYHLGYSWPGRPEVPDVADELWTFGAFWGDSTPLPGQMQTRVIGAPYVSSLADGAAARNPDLVVFTSQGVIGRRLFAVALETARRRPDKTIVFRLHPNETLADFETLVPADAPANFSVSARTPNIFALLAGAEIQVGAFSTTLFEGMALGVRTIVLDMPGIEYMTPVIERGDVLYVKTVDDLVAQMDEAPRAQDPTYYYATPETFEDLKTEQDTSGPQRELSDWLKGVSPLPFAWHEKGKPAAAPDVRALRTGLLCALTEPAIALLEAEGSNEALLALAQHAASRERHAEAVALLARSSQPLGAADQSLDLSSRIASGQATEADIGRLGADVLSDSDRALFKANFALTDEGYWYAFNAIYRAQGLSELRPTRPGPPRFGSFTATPATPIESDVRVTILMPSYNAEQHIGFAIASLLAQSWRNIEIIAVDDCSTDGTFAKLNEIARRDPRLVVAQCARNGGAYHARNTGLRLATGDFVTVHDSDDWAHPQRIAVQVQAMIASGSPVSATTAVRVRQDMEVRYRVPQRTHLLMSFPSLMYPRRIIDALGGWDEVRMGGDAELYARVRAITGEQVEYLDQGTPYNLMLATADSLTGSSLTGLDSISYGARKQYLDAYTRWHKTLTPDDFAAAALDPAKRKFHPPRICLEKNARIELDSVFILDFSTPDAVAHDAIRAALANGHKVGVVHWPVLRAGMANRAHPTFSEILEGSELQVLVPGEMAHASQVVLARRSLAEMPPDRLPVIHATTYRILRD